MYALILLAYIIKIITIQSLPRGEIGQLVSPFLVIGTLTWLILDPPFIQAKRLARWFHKLWFPLMIPASVLLAIAIFVRVSAYGWTIERYLLVLTAVWALGIALWYTFRGEAKRDIRIIPGFAALLLTFGSIGPWGAEGLSVISQSARLTDGLSANDMLDAEGGLKPVSALKLDDKEAAVQARGALDYLLKMKKHKRIQHYMGSDGFPDFEVKDSPEWRKMDEVRTRFGLDKVKLADRYTRIADKTMDLRTYQPVLNYVGVSGYDFIITGNAFTLRRSGKVYAQMIRAGAFSLQYEDGNIVVKAGGDEVSRFDLLDWLERQDVDNFNNLKLDPHIVVYRQGDQEIALWLTRVNITIEEDQNTHGSIAFALLLKGIDPEGR